MSGWIKRNALLAYYVLALLISWLIELPLVAAAQGWFNSPVPFAAHYLAAFGPMLSALIVTGLGDGVTGLQELWSRIIKWRVRREGALFAILFPTGMYGLAVVAVGVFTGEWPDPRRLGEVNYLPDLGIGALLLWLASFGFGEEIGWRGFALPRLQHGRSALAASLILGLLWSIWHIPAFFYLDTYENLSLILIPGFVFGVFCGAVLLTWLYNTTNGSVLMVALWHALFDFFSASRANPEAIAIIISVGVVFWAIRVLKVYGPQNLAPVERHSL